MGSEMCIRDRDKPELHLLFLPAAGSESGLVASATSNEAEFVPNESFDLAQLLSVLALVGTEIPMASIARSVEGIPGSASSRGGTVGRR